MPVGVCIPRYAERILIAELHCDANRIGLSAGTHQYSQRDEIDMALKDELIALVTELDRVHSGAISWCDEFEMPDFVTAANGMQRHFTRNARKAVMRLSEVIYSNRLHSSLKVELEKYEKIVRQVVADMHAEGEFETFCKTGDKTAVKKMKALIEEQIASIAQEYTHYFPAWTVGVERESPFTIGPVRFLTRAQWIDSVDFPESGKERFLDSPEANHQWKEILKQALQKPRDLAPLEGLAGVVYGAVNECPSLLEVTIRDYEKEYSRKLAKLVCKTALDAISLGLGGAEFFHQQALQEERLPPVGSYSLIGSNGFLWLPGISLSKRIPHLSDAHVAQALAHMANILPAFSSILNGLVNPAGHKHPKLANRWATALDWFGEGNRESSDAIAVAKFGTCLDVLSCGGKYEGIAQMVTHLTGIKEDTQVIQEPLPRTLKQLVKDIYDEGRSKILHGTYFDRLESFSRERQRAAHLAKIVLIESALRLEHYIGDDEDKAFSAMPARQSTNAA